MQEWNHMEVIFQMWSGMFLLLESKGYVTVTPKERQQIFILHMKSYTTVALRRETASGVCLIISTNSSQLFQRERKEYYHAF